MVLAAGTARVRGFKQRADRWIAGPWKTAPGCVMGLVAAARAGAWPRRDQGAPGW